MSDCSDRLALLVSSSEEWLMERILAYAKDLGYTRYTSTLIEAWRVSIAGLSKAFIDALQRFSTIPELGPDEEFRDDPMARFGIIAARNHRVRGVTYQQFMGLMKYYRQSYLDLVLESALEQQEKSSCQLLVARFFDRVELAFSVEWLSLREEHKLEELRAENRRMTNEKNKYLTIFESQRDPTILINPKGLIENANHAAQALILGETMPGAAYYSQQLATKELPWFNNELKEFAREHPPEHEFEQEITTVQGRRHFHVRFHKMLDRSEKYTGIVVMLTDITRRIHLQQEREKLITELQQALDEIKTLRGIVPICMYCKKIRNDEGFWDQVESYVARHTKAEFSHGICEDCMSHKFPEVYSDLKKKGGKGIPKNNQ